MMSLSIRFKVIIFFLLLSIGPFLVISILVYQQVAKTIENSAFDHLSTLADLQKARIQQVVRFQTLNIEHLVLQDEFVQAEKNFRQQPTPAHKTDLVLQLQSIADSVKNYQKASLVRIDGTVIASTDPESPERLPEKAPYLQTASEHTDVSQFVKIPPNTLRQFVITKVPSNPEGQLFLVVEVDADSILKIFQDDSGLGKTGQLALGAYNPDKVGVVLIAGRYNPDPYAAMNEPIRNPSETKSPLRLAINQQEKTVSDTVTYQGVPVLSSTRYLPETGWGLVVTQEMSEIYAPLLILQRQFVMVISSTILFALLASSYVARRFVRRISAVKTAAQKIANGDLDVQISITMKDEIGEMARSFNSMAHNLSQSYRSVSEAKLKDEIILEAIDEAIVTVDINGIITGVNSKVNQFFASEQPLQLIGKNVVDCFDIFDEQHQKLDVEKRPLSLSLRQKKVVHMENCYLHSSREFAVQIVASPIVINGKLEEAVEIIRDMTKEKHVEAMKDEFVSIAAHQLRTPLGTTRWSLERLIADKVGKLPVKAKQSLNEIAESNLRLIVLVNSLLDVSRINQNRIDPHFEPVDTSALFHSVLAQFKEIAKKHQVTFTLNSSLPQKHQIHTDLKMFRVVLENLLENALKYNVPNGKISLSAEEENQFLSIKIVDTGIGIPDKEQRNLFEKFYRGANVTKKGIDGTGLGLFIVRSYLQLLGGTIRIESQEGVGTTCTILLPLKRSKA